MASSNPYPEIVNSRNLEKLRGVSFGHINIHSLFPKHDEIMTLLHRSDLDYLGVSETWLSPHVENHEISIPGYTLFRLDRQLEHKKEGGGVAAFIKNHYTFIHLEESNLCTSDVE